MNYYECEFCIANKLYEGRACYRDRWPGKESYTFKVPIFDDTSPYPVGSTEEVLDEEDFMEVLLSLEMEKPDVPPYELVRTYFSTPEYCPIGSVDFEYQRLLTLEAAARQYHTLPYAGGLLDQPNCLIDAFDIIASERNQYERIRYDKMESERKSQGKGSPGGPQTTHRGAVPIRAPQIPGRK